MTKTLYAKNEGDTIRVDNYGQATFYEGVAVPDNVATELTRETHKGVKLTPSRLMVRDTPPARPAAPPQDAPTKDEDEQAEGAAGSAQDETEPATPGE